MHLKKTADETKRTRKRLCGLCKIHHIQLKMRKKEKNLIVTLQKFMEKDVMDNDGNTEGLATGGINDGKYYHDYDVDPTRGIKETDLEYTSEKVGEGDYEKRKSNLVYK